MLINDLMTYDVAKEKLHYLIEQADEEKVKAIYTLLVGDSNGQELYSDELLEMLEKRADDAFSGKTRSISHELLLSNIRTRRMKHGL